MGLEGVIRANVAAIARIMMPCLGGCTAGQASDVLAEMTTRSSKRRGACSV